MSVEYEVRDGVAVIAINRPERRNAVDRATATALGEAWRRFDRDASAAVAVFTGRGGHFSAGADLKAFDLVDTPEGFLGFTRMWVSKPTIAAVEGACVAGGLEMALWCDLRVAGRSAFFGCLERRFGVPLVDGGTQRLPRVVGLGRALDLILTGRVVAADEALAMGLVNRVVDDGEALEESIRMAKAIASFPRETVLTDRRAVWEGIGRSLEEGLEIERRIGSTVLDVAAEGARRFAQGEGRSGAPVVGVGSPSSGLDSPSGGSHRVGLLVVPDRWGVTPSVREVAEELCREGFVTNIPDLSGLFASTGPAVAGGEAADLDAVLRRLVTELNELVDDPRVAGGRVGVLGFGAGAGLALWLAALDRRVSACVTFGAYMPLGRRPGFRRARAAFLGHSGEEDPKADPRSAYLMEKELRELGLDATFYVYPEAGADFWDPEKPEAYKLGAARLAWERTIGFLNRVLAIR